MRTTGESYLVNRESYLGLHHFPFTNSILSVLSVICGEI